MAGKIHVHVHRGKAKDAGPALMAEVRKLQAKIREVASYAQTLSDSAADNDDRELMGKLLKIEGLLKQASGML